MSLVLGQHQEPASGVHSGAADQHVQGRLLEELATVVSTIKQRHHQQACTSSTDNQVRKVRHSEAALDPIRAVQDGLRHSSAQLQRLLLQQGRALPAAQINKQAQPLYGQHSPAEQVSKAVSSSSPSLEVLQQLLQLAVGTSATQVAQDSNKEAAAGPAAPTAHQQQLWIRAAWEALQLFSFQELEQLPSLSLQQALLLHPRLLDPFLEAAAAAVLQPVQTALSSSLSVVAGDEPSGSARAAGQPGSSSQAGASCSSDRPRAGSTDSKRSSKVQSIQSLLAAACPWIQWLPTALARNPLLLLKASSTLLGWLEASGHNRMWRLLDITCRSPWQHLAAAVTATTTEATAASDGAPAIPLSAWPPSTHPPSCATTSSGWPGPRPQAASAGAMQLLCPQPWQQELVCLLCEEPSVAGLLQLLQLLTRSCQPHSAGQDTRPHRSHEAASAGSGGNNEAAVDADAAGSGAAVGVAGAGGRTEVLLAWPSVEEWWQPVQDTAVPDAAENDAAQDAGTGPVGDGLLAPNTSKATMAWGLLMQHHCWYEFACFLLMQCSLHHLQQQQHPGSSSQQQLWCGADQQVSGLLQLQRQALQQRAAELPCSQVAACAAALIAWVHQPVDINRQRHLREQLLSRVALAATSSCREQLPQYGLDKSLVLAGRLLTAWRAPHAPGGCKGCTGCSSPALFMQDLPCAALQQRQLLQSCTPDQLVELCLQACAAPTPFEDALQTKSPGSSTQHLADAQLCRHSQEERAVSGDSTGPEGRPSASALCQLLDASNGICAAALEVVNASVHGQVQRQQQPKDHGSGTLGKLHVSWLARQWMQDRISCSDGAGKAAAGTAAQPTQVLELPAAKQLLAAATGVDQQLKQRASCWL